MTCYGINKQARKTSAKWFQLPSDSELRAKSVFTEKAFPNEKISRILPNATIENNYNSRGLRQGCRRKTAAMPTTGRH